MLNSYIDDKTAIGALTEDFENYLRLLPPIDADLQHREHRGFPRALS